MSATASERERRRDPRFEGARVAGLLVYRANGGNARERRGQGEDTVWQAICLALGVDPKAYFRREVTQDQREDLDYMYRWDLAQDVWDSIIP